MVHVDSKTRDCIQKPGKDHDKNVNLMEVTVEKLLCDKSKEEDFSSVSNHIQVSCMK
jgi:hypothetical protein